MKEEFFKLKEYLKNEYLRMSDEKDEILREKVQLEVERDREESPLFSEKDKNQIKRLFSPLSDEAFHSVFQEDKNESKISKKIDYLREINLDFVVLEDTKQLIQSVDLTYARYEYFKSKNQNIDSNNYRLLFYNNKKFTKQFGIEKKELLETYSYKNREERRNVI